MRTETGHPRFGQIVTGHYRQGKGYYAWRSQGTRDWLFIYTVSGQGRFGYHGGEWLSQPGEAALLRPGTLHDYGVTAPAFRWELLWAHFHPRSEWHEWLAWPEIAPGLGAISIQQPYLRARIETRLKDMHALATGPERRAELFAMNAFEEILLCFDAQNPRAESTPLDSRIRESMDHINRNLAAAIPLAKLAAVARLSASRYAHLFREQVGTTPQQYMEQQRLNRAQQLLELTPMSVKEIAYEVGFSNPFYFTLRFTKRFGKSPRAYRQRRKA